ncbi:unnamed protein product [Zymoseptoria tritici ST99CH_3D1]|uniref:Hydrophobin n=1 Tax=Zymoseptoria tritici ST99CH_1E4 TaxID=1276532 RepID=A0A2H1FX90_ZYMTR|nr:unnamed protein product [Zymoseptoria tritici ST99CH_1E4]SMR47106.1 unnamed protein product [Zymoseptoria tritici ST99CH_3D1]
MQPITILLVAAAVSSAFAKTKYFKHLKCQTDPGDTATLCKGVQGAIDDDNPIGCCVPEENANVYDRVYQAYLSRAGAQPAAGGYLIA